LAPINIIWLYSTASLSHGTEWNTAYNSCRITLAFSHGSLDGSGPGCSRGHWLFNRFDNRAWINWSWDSL